jgi:hypothetical protein
MMSKWGGTGCRIAFIAAVALAACSKAPDPDQGPAGGPPAVANDGSTGTLNLRLILPDGESLGPVSYTLSGASGTVQSGTVSVSHSQSIDFQLATIPAGSGYTIALSSGTDAGVSCFGSSGPFAVVAHQTVSETVQLICVDAAGDGGNLFVSGVVSYCGTWQSLSTVGPGVGAGPTNGSEVYVGSTVSISATASGADPTNLAYAWSSSLPIGMFGANDATGTSDQITFTCTAPGMTTITLVVSDGPLPQGQTCPTTLSTISTPVYCDPLPCNTAADCPGVDVGCETRACTNNTCVLNVAAAGTLAPNQTVGDCHDNECDGSGGVVTVIDNTDIPVVNACQSGSCNAGMPVVASLPIGTNCGMNPNMVCDGAGTCNPCNVATDCSGTDTTCSQRVCTATHQCSVNLAPEFTACSTGGGTICDGVGNCNPISFAVTRISGDGVNAHISTSAPVTVEQRRGDGTLLSSYPLPTTAPDGGSNNPFTLTMAAVSEGAITRSANGRYVTLAGYATGAGIANVPQAPNTNRVVARLDWMGNLDTSTQINPTQAFSGQNVRGAVSDDGTHFWVSGLGGGTTGGLVYAPLGNSPSTSPVILSMDQLRVVEIFGNMLFADGETSGANSTPPEIFQVDTTLPTSGTPAMNELPGLPVGVVPSPWQFVFFDLSSAVPGLDTLYVANDTVTKGADGGAMQANGIQKWIFNGTTWTYFGSLSALSTAPTPSGFRGLSGVAVGPNVTLMATTVDTGSLNNRIAVFTDPGAFTTNYTTSAAPTGTVVAQTTNQMYRGVGVWPHQ